jgi:prepilin signal peptidase PulO-like enzyme (type II secretory pathway)
MLAFLFLVGCVLGSFLNVVALRGEKGETLRGRSHCFSCKKKLAWYELIPLFSFLFQKGRCRVCRVHIPFQYPLVELGTGIVFFAIGYFGSWEYALSSLGTLVLTLGAWSILVVILVRDMRTTIIPDSYNACFALISLFLLLVRQEKIVSQEMVWALLAGPLLFTPFYLLWRFSDGKWIGLGDGKLAWGIGWFLGLPLGISAILYGFWLGALISLGILMVQKVQKKKNTLTLTSEIPFAPFLILGIACAYFSGYTVLDAFSLFFFL